jgi:hypothetical protein
MFQGGQTIAFSADALDPETGMLPPSAFSWRVELLREADVQPVTTLSGASAGTFVVPVTGENFEGNTRYRIVCTVVDAHGQTTQATVVVDPRKVGLAFTTEPSGLQIAVDGIARTTPFVKDGLVGFQHQIEAPTQRLGGFDYTFRDWSDGGTQAHTIVVPPVSLPFVARFDARPAPPGAPGLVAAYNFDSDAGGAIPDRSGHGNGGVCSPGSTCPRFDPGGHTLGAYDFAGSGNYVALSNESSFDFTTRFSATFWMKTSAFTNRYEALVAKGDSAWSVDRSRSENVLSFTTWSSAAPDELVGSTPVADGQWHHVAVVYDGTSKRLYVDGQLDASSSYSFPVDTNNLNVRLGANEQYEPGQYGGHLDDVRIYDRALSAQEVTNDMNTPVP